MKKFYIDISDYTVYNARTSFNCRYGHEYWNVDYITLSDMKSYAKYRQYKTLNLFYLLFVNKVFKKI